MAHHKSAIKRIKKSREQNQRNRAYRTRLRNMIKSVLAIDKKDSAEPKLREAVSLLDRLAAKKIIHRNKAANQKARLTKFVNGLS